MLEFHGTSTTFFLSWRKVCSTSIVMECDHWKCARTVLLRNSEVLSTSQAKQSRQRLSPFCSFVSDCPEIFNKFEPNRKLLITIWEPNCLHLKPSAGMGLHAAFDQKFLDPFSVNVSTINSCALRTAPKQVDKGQIIFRLARTLVKLYSLNDIARKNATDVHCIISNQWDSSIRCNQQFSCTRRFKKAMTWIKVQNTRNPIAVNQR